MSIKHSLLALLSEGPATASQLQHRFSTQLANLWPLNIGQVAQTLTRLERDGLITAAGQATGPTGRHATQYALTQTGGALLEEWWSQSALPTTNSPTNRDELVLKIALASQRHDVDLVAVLDAQRFAVLRQLRELNQQAAALPEARSAPRLAVERRIFDLESQSRFLDRVEALASPHTTDSPKES